MLYGSCLTCCVTWACPVCVPSVHSSYVTWLYATRVAEAQLKSIFELDVVAGSGLLIKLIHTPTAAIGAPLCLGCCTLCTHWILPQSLPEYLLVYDVQDEKGT